MRCSRSSVVRVTMEFRWTRPRLSLSARGWSSSMLARSSTWWLRTGSPASTILKTGASDRVPSRSVTRLLETQGHSLESPSGGRALGGGGSWCGSFRVDARGSSRTCAACSLMNPQLRHVNGKACAPRSTAKLPPTCPSSTRSSHPSHSLLPQKGHSRRAPRLRRNANIGRFGLTVRADALSTVEAASTRWRMPWLPPTCPAVSSAINDPGD